MKGIILKDLLSLRPSVKIITAFIVVFGIMGIYTRNDFLVIYSAVYAAISPITCFSLDETSRFNRFASTLPISSVRLVLCKYIIGIIFVAAAFIISLMGLSLGASSSIWSSLCMAILIPLVYQTVAFPVFFKFGVEKSRFISMAIFLIPTAVFIFWDKFGLIYMPLRTLTAAQQMIIFLIGTVFLIGMYICSVALSVKFYKNKEW